MVNYEIKQCKKFINYPITGIFTKPCIMNSSMSICSKHAIDIFFVYFLEETRHLEIC